MTPVLEANRADGLQGQVDPNRQPETDITLGQAVSRWLEIAKLDDTTRDRYEDLVRMYVGPVLGDLAARQAGRRTARRFLPPIAPLP